MVSPLTVSVNIIAGADTRAEIDLDRGYELRGRVVDDSRRGVAHAEVHSFSANVPQIGFPMTTTDLGGAFRLTGLAAATYTITARKEGFIEESIDADPSAQPEVALTLRRGGAIAGRILGVRADELASVEVHAGGMPGVGASAQPDASGAFTLRGIPDGEVIVYGVQHRPYLRQVQSEPVTVINGTAPSVDLDFSAGFVVTGRVTRARRAVTAGWISFSDPEHPGGPQVAAEVGRDGVYNAMFVTPGDYEARISLGTLNNFYLGQISVRGAMHHDFEIGGASVSGRVVDDLTREPVGGARVGATREGDPYAHWFSDGTDALGRFVIEPIADGRWTVTVKTEGYLPERRELVVENGYAPDFEVALTRGEMAMIRVLSAEGQPLDASVTVRDDLGEMVFSGQPPRDENGVLRMILRPGRYTIDVVASDFTSGVATIVVPGPLVEIRSERKR